MLLTIKLLHDEIVRWDEGDSKIFLHPVDPSDAPDYHQVIKNPMDLTMIGNKIRAGDYANVWPYVTSTVHATF